MDMSTRKAIYCPVCAKVCYMETNVLGEVIWEDENSLFDFSSKKCRACGHEFIVLDEPLSNFYTECDDIDEEIFISSKYIIISHILNNPEYNANAHAERLRRLIKESAENGNMGKRFRLELKEFFDIDMDIPIKSTPRQSYYTPSNTVQCPRCHSTSITTKDKFSTGGAVTGGLIGGVVGALIGGKSGGKTVNVCQNCGHQWEPGKRW